MSANSKTHNREKWSESEVPKTMEMKTRKEKQTMEMKKRKEKQGSSKRASPRVKNTITSGCSNSNLSSSSSGSLEAPRGCLRFLLSHSSSSYSSSFTSCTTKTAFNRNCPAKTTANFISKTPKSAPLSRLPHFKPSPLNSSSKPLSRKADTVKKSQSSRKPISKALPFLDSKNADTVIGSLSVSQYLLKLPENEDKELLQFTPVAASKSTTCSALDCVVDIIYNNNHNDKVMVDEKSNASSSNTKTPPIQASFSPEIQSTTTTTTSTTTTNTPACYGAGHLISGVTDRRKCKARGLLAVALPADNYMSTDHSNDVDLKQGYAAGLGNKSSVSMLASPAEASMHWLNLSPCHEGDEDDKENSVPLNALLQPKELPFPSSQISHLGFSLDLCNFSSNTSDNTNSKTTRMQSSTNSGFISTQFQVRSDSLCDYAFVSSSPCATPYSPSIPLKEEAKHCYTNIGGFSPFSTDTLGSENVMQTPNSDSTLELERHVVGLSCSSAKDPKRHHFHSEMLSLAGDLPMANLSPKSHVSVWDSTNSSFQFDRLTTPSHSMDFSPFQKILDDKFLWTSDSTFENVSQSQMRISWREGLVSRIFEMDEFDSCRFLSDEEDDLNVKSSDPFKSCQSLDINVDVGNVPTMANTCGSAEFLCGESKKERHSPEQCSYTESICTDGSGGLTHSEDSDWNLYYKNNLFEL